jgi:phage anti-repressor protein/uncharacterized coiled-coil protein SlyX
MIGEETVNTVDGRELHASLGIRKDFSNWMKSQIDKLGMEKGIDFITVALKGDGVKFANIDYTLTLEFAKHISMASRTPRGKLVRTYLIEIEKRFWAERGVTNTPLDQMARGEQPQVPQNTYDTRVLALMETQSETLSQMMLASQRQSEMMMQAMNIVSTLEMRVRDQSSLITDLATEVIKHEQTIERMRSQVTNSAIIAKDLNSYLRYQPLSREEKKRLGSKVTTRAQHLCQSYGVSLEVATRSTWGLLNKRFNVTSYHDLTHENFLRAYDYVELIELDGTSRDIDENRYEPYDRHSSHAKNVFGDRDMPDEFSQYVDLGGIIIIEDEE